MTSPSSPILLAALAYAKRGWPVFPLVPEGKTPLTSNGFKAASTDRDIILGWWVLHPNANVGIATGDASFDVLDIDSMDGLAALRVFQKEHGVEEWRHDGPVSCTGKGWHLLYAPTGTRNRTKLLDAPIDWRANGGYIVAPPSIHPLGHTYRWDAAHRRTEKTTLPEAPPWLTSLLGPDQVPLPPPPTEIIREIAPDGLPITVVAFNKIAEERPDIISVANSLGIKTKIRGTYAMASCPFHKDDTPSLTLYPTPQNKFFCHGCGAHGDSHDLAARKDINGRSFL